MRSVLQRLRGFAGSPRLPLCLGFGLLWSLTKGFMNSEVFRFPDKAADIDGLFFAYTALSTVIACVFVFASASRTAGRAKDVPAWLPALLAALGLLLLEKGEIMLSSLGCILCAVGMTWLFVLWFAAFAGASGTRFPVDVPVGFLIGNLLAWLYAALDMQEAGMVYAVGLFASAIAHGYAARSPQGAFAAPSASSDSLSLASALRPTLMTFVSFFAVSVISIAMSYIALFQRDAALETQIWIHLAGPTAGALLALVLCRMFTAKINAAQVSIFLMATLVLFLPVFRVAYVPLFKLLSMAVVELLFVQAVALAVRAAEDCPRQLHALGGICWAALSLSTLLGSAIGLICAQLSLDEVLFYGCLGTLFAYLLVMALMFLVPMSSRRREKRSGEVPAAAPNANEAGGRLDVLGKVADSCGLTPREHEVLALLAVGRSTTYIAKLLCISPDTAKGHTRHIYQKMQVHSKQELLDRLYGSKDEGESASRIS